MVDADIVIDPAEVELDEVSRAFLDSDEADPTNRKNVEIFTDFSEREPEGKRAADRAALPALAGRDPGRRQGRARSWSASTSSTATTAGAIRARDTGEREEIECGLVLRSIGYKGIGLEGVPFDETRGVDPQRGRPRDRRRTGEQIPGQYVVGWIKRGPSGVIGTNKKDAQETVDNARRGRWRRAGCPSPRRRRRRTRSRSCCAEREPDFVELRRLGGDRRRREERAASRRAARGSSSAASTRCSRPRAASRSAPMAMADLAEVERLIAEALPGAEVEVVDEGGGDHLRAIVERAPVRGPEPDRPAPAGQARRPAPDGRRHDPRALDQARPTRAR